MGKIDTVYFDMDGVLCDFDRLAAHRFGGEAQSADGSVPWKADFESWFVQECATGTFFLDLPGSPHLDDMIELMYSLLADGVRVGTLTSFGGRGSYDRIRQQKCQWLCDNLPDEIVSAIEFNGVNHCDDKWAYGKPGTYLIDDKLSNVVGFRMAGGGGFHYSFDHHEAAMENIRGHLAQVRADA